MAERSGSGRPGGEDSRPREIRTEDRRRFDPTTGERRPERGAPGEVPLPGGGVLRMEKGGGDEGLPVGFADLVRPFLLLGLAGLGVVPHPETDRRQIDLGAARSAIESLRLLKAKTEGRRTEEEDRLLTEALFELELQYVELKRRREP
ncbi:MAG: DUF1844 domain-containing protein [Acidobacteria bacterium]|nr:MAG: DUF1844 domain-containing protein [Acidobacteriota bacterium]